jgi:hypothetical protein
MLENLLYLHCYVKNYNTWKYITREHQKLNIPKIEKPQKWATPLQIAFVAVFAALFVALAVTLPSLKIPSGIGNIEISFSALIASVFGLVLGPYLGAAAALLGASIAWGFTGGIPTNLPFIFAPMFNALIVGLIFYKKWKYSFLIYTALIVVFLFTPPVMPIYGQSGIPGVGNWWIAASVLFDKIIALALIVPLALLGKKIASLQGVIVLGRKLSGWTLKIGPGVLFFFLLGFVGNQADNMWGSLAFATPPVYSLFGMNALDVQGAFLISPFLYPAIRIVEAVIVMVIAVPLYAVLSKTNWLWRKETILTVDTKTKTSVTEEKSSSA